MTAARSPSETARCWHELQDGLEPYAAHHGELFRVRSAVTTSEEADFHRLLASVAEELVAR